MLAAWSSSSRVVALIEALEQRISRGSLLLLTGRDVYLDVAGWHLYLKDVKVGGSINLAQGLAQQLGSQIDGQGFREADMQVNRSCPSMSSLADEVEYEKSTKPEYSTRLHVC